MAMSQEEKSAMIEDLIEASEKVNEAIEILERWTDKSSTLEKYIIPQLRIHGTGRDHHSYLTKDSGVLDVLKDLEDNECVF